MVQEYAEGAKNKFCQVSEKERPGHTEVVPRGAKNKFCQLLEKEQRGGHTEKQATFPSLQPHFFM